MMIDSSGRITKYKSCVINYLCPSVSKYDSNDKI